MVGRGEEVAISVVTHIHIFNITGSSDHLANVLEDVWRELQDCKERGGKEEEGGREGRGTNEQSHH